MATLRFVESDLSALRLSLNWIEGESDLDLPEHEKQWAESLHADGQTLVSGHWTGRTIHLALHIHGTSKVDRNSDARALIAELTRENILEFDDGSNPVWVKTYPMNRAQITGRLERWLESKYMLHPFTVDIPADSFWFGPKQTLTPVHNMLRDLPGYPWSFEYYAGSGNTTDWQAWTETRTNGSGTATVEALAAAAFHGVVGCHLKITSNDGVASVLGGIMYPDITKYHNIIFRHHRASGADSLKCKIKQYDAAGNDLGADIVITPAGAAAWRLSSTVIGPSGLGGIQWDAATVKIKLLYTVDTAIADWYVDAICLTESEYLPGHELTNPLAMLFAPADLMGDVPAPCDIYIDKWDATVAATAAIYIGGRASYDVAFSAHTENTQGTAALSALASGGAYRTITIPGELCLNPSLDDIVGVAGSNTETWDYWTAVRGAGAEMIAATDGPPKDGTYCVIIRTLTIGAYTVCYLYSDLMAVNPALPYLTSIWYSLVPNASGAGLLIEARCYNAASAYISSLTILSTMAGTWGWKQAPLLINPADWPAGTAKAAFGITAQTHRIPGGQDVIGLDLASFQQASSALAAEFADYVDSLKGFVKPFLHYRVSAAANKNLILQGKLTSPATGDITDYTELETLAVSMPEVWTYEATSRLRLPNAAASDAADMTAIQQALQILFDPTLTGGGTIDVDDLALIPTGSGMGYAKIEAEENEHLILDSTSRVPTVLVSQDGTLDRAVVYSVSALAERFKLDPQTGANLGALMILTDANGNAIGQWTADVKIEYYPRYLAVK